MISLLIRCLAKTWWNPDDEFKKNEKEFPVNLAIPDLEDKFQAKVIVRAPAAVKTDFVQILDAKRGKNCGIMLQSRFKKISFDDLVMAIMNCDWNSLTAGDVNALKQFIPTPDEVRVKE